MLCLGLCTIAVLAASGPQGLEPTDRFFVNDFANVIDQDAEDEIFAIGRTLQEKTQAQVVVVTVQSIGDMALEEYTYQLAKSWGIGDEEKDNGVLLFLTIDERQSRIEVGYGLEGALTDGMTGRIQDEYMLPYYREGDYSNGLLNGYKAVVGKVYEEYGIDADLTEEYPVEEESEGGRWIVALPFVLVLLFVIIAASSHGGRGGRGGGGGFRPIIFFGAIPAASAAGLVAAALAEEEVSPAEAAASAGAAVPGILTF